MYDYQTSDLIFEKVLDSDRATTQDPIIAFLEQNGNFYYQTPLMSLARTYHKTDDYGHKQLIKQFSDVLQNYSIDESDDLLTVLNIEKDNPRLLIILKNKIDGFTNKSPVTTVGKLYSQMASNIVLADTFISKQEVVSKRQIANHKIKDFRNLLLPNLIKDESGGYIYAVSDDSKLFISEPLASISVYPFSYYSVPKELILDPDNLPPSLLYDFVTQLNSYYFVDYEKLLNYKSEISKIFNPYNIIQIFGKGALANYFSYKTVSVIRPNATTFQYANGGGSTVYSRSMILNYSDGVPSTHQMIYYATEGQPSAVAGVEGVFVEAVPGAGRYSFDKIVFGELPDNNADAYKYAQLVQRYPNTIRNLGDYRISCFELTDFERPHATDHFFRDEFTFKVEIEDSTMLFYENFIKRKITSLKDKLKKYLDFAEDFCSFNNIDNKFNDFFVENIRQQFVEPYPWTEAPLYYYLFSQLINLSVSDTTVDNRIRNGLLIDFESVKTTSLAMAKNISPESGNLNSLQTFYNLLENLVNDYFIKGGYLDTKFNIYKNTTNDFTGRNQLQNPMKTFSMERKDDYCCELRLTPIDYIDVFGSIEEYEQYLAAQAAARAQLEEQAEEMTRKCYGYQVTWVNRQMDLFYRVYEIARLNTKRKREEEAGNLNDVKNWMNKQEEAKNNYRDNNCSEHSPGGIKYLVAGNITGDWLYDLGYGANVPTDLDFTLAYINAKVKEGL